MRIDRPTSDLPAGPRTHSATNGAASAASFSDALTAAQSSGVKQTDFTNMTRHDMRDWVNNQIRDGQMSLDDSRSFMAMTMKIPVNGAAGELSATSDSTRYDFMQKARDGIEAAVSRQDDAMVTMLNSAMSIMRQQQRQALGIDIRA